MFRPRSKAFFPLLFAVVVLFYIGRAAFGGKIIFGSDVLSVWYFARSFAFSSIREGILPLWNPYMCSGMPFMAEPQSAIFYPPNLTFLFLDTRQALNLSVILHVYLAWLSMYLLARRMEMGPVPAALSATSFSFSGFFLPRIFGGHLPVINAAAWLPAIFLAFDMGLRGKRAAAWMVLTAVLLAFQLLAGHPQFVAFTLIVIILYMVYCLIRGEVERRRIGYACACVVLAAGLAAIQILPAAELFRHSIRSSPQPYREATLISMPPENLVTLAVPGFFGGTDMIDSALDLAGEDFGRAISDQYWGRGIYWEMCPYIGVIPLMLAFIAVGRLWRTNSHVPFLAILALISLVIALGKYTPVYGVLYRAVPGFRAFESPARALFVFIFCTALLAGCGLGLVMDSERKPLGFRHLIIVCAIMLSALAIIALLTASWTDILRASLYRGDRLTYLPGPHDTLFRQLTFARARLGILAAAVWFSIGAVLLSGAFPGRLKGGLVLAVVLADLALFGSRYCFGVRLEDYLWDPGEVATLREAAGDGRIICSTGLASLNEGALWRIPNICGFGPMILNRYNEYINLCKGLPVKTCTKILGIGQLRKDRRRLLDLLGASAFVIPRTVKATGLGEPIPLGSGGSVVYRNDACLPPVIFPREVLVVESSRRALAELSFPAFDPEKTLILEEPLAPHLREPVSEGSPEPSFSRTAINVNEIKVAVSTDRDRFMLLSEISYPGWRASVDGEETRIYRADYILRAIRIPKGDHGVRIWFDPSSLKKGTAVSVISCLASLIILIFASRRI